MTHNIAIVSVAYNRVNSLARQIASLQQAKYPENTTLIISIDKSDNDDVERYAREIEWTHGEKRIVTHRENLGLRRHILSVGQLLEEFDALVVLEDDITVVPHFMSYVLACTDKYAGDDRIAGISLYCYNVHHKSIRPFTPAASAYDVFFMNVAMSWGQVWMKRQWLDFYKWYQTHSEEFDLPHIPDNVNHWKSSSWLKYHIRYCIEQNKYFVYPYISLTANNADAGTHMKVCETVYQSPLQLFPRNGYALPATEECPVLYDGFMEPKFLGRYLDIEEAELTVDFHQSRRYGQWNRYLLSTRILPFHTIASYALELSPYEANIIFDRKGDGIWLYDTTIDATPPKQPDRYRLYHYLYKKGFYDALFMIGPRRIMVLLRDLVFYKLNQKFHLNLPTHIS
ncbi:MAG: hypothetical protein K2J00_07065 [Bacteroidaceae bacterium]|nr:hypothetical protein [Bacteroidaceae bacterium]